MTTALLISKKHNDITHKFNYVPGELFRLLGAKDVRIIRLEEQLTKSELDHVLAARDCYSIVSLSAGRYDGYKTVQEGIALPTVSMGAKDFLIWKDDISEDDYLLAQPHRVTLIFDTDRLGSNKDISNARIEGHYYVDPTYIEQMKQALHKP